MTGSFLDEDKRDALQELVNMGMGSAGAALATLLGDFVELTVPRIEPIAPSDISAKAQKGAWSSRAAVAVRQPFFGQLMGESVMLFDSAGYSELALRLGYGLPLSGDAEREIALDLANIVIGAVVNGIAEPLAELVSFARPALLVQPLDLSKIVAHGLSSWQQAMLVTVDFHLRSCRFESLVLVLLSQGSQAHIDRALARFLENLAS